MPGLRRIPSRTYCQLVDRALAASRNGPVLSDVMKRRLRAVAKAADDLEQGRPGDVVAPAEVLDWMEAISAETKGTETT